jgi:hypothetical protein
MRLVIHNILSKRIDNPASGADQKFITSPSTPIPNDIAMIRGDNVSGICHSPNSPNGYAKQTKYARHHMNALLTCKNSIWAKFGVRAGYLTRGQNAE